MLKRSLVTPRVDLNIATGGGALYSNTTGSENTAYGRQALYNNTTGFYNEATGTTALYSNTTGFRNIANGRQALFANTTGSRNTAVGNGALATNTIGSANTALGFQAGFNLTGDNNIDIGNEGVVGESNTIRIGGDVGAGFAPQTATFIDGIRGVTTGNADAIAVVIDSAGQLGTVSSSERFKKDIKPMDQSSQAILALKPVTFHYKTDSTGTPQFGLIAEEVAKVNRDLVVRDGKGEIYTVRYEAVNAMLLNEFLKEHQKVEALEGTVAQLKSTVAQQQKDFAAQLKQLNTKIQAVNDKVELTKPAPRSVKK